MADLKGKVAIVTGGGRGIGAAIARRLAADGADVAITYTKAADEAAKIVRAIEQTGRRGLAIQAEAAEAEAVTQAVERTARELGGLDILVNNAGVFEMAPTGESELAVFDRVFAINVRGSYVAIQAAAKHMRDGGRIVQIGSVNADHLMFPGSSVYGASKAAVRMLARGAALDLAPRKITVNTVQPGPVDTDMNPADGPFADTLKGFMAIKEYAKPDEIAALVAYLVSKEAALVTGAFYDISGGISL